MRLGLAMTTRAKRMAALIAKFLDDRVSLSLATASRCRLADCALLGNDIRAYKKSRSARLAVKQMHDSKSDPVVENSRSRSPSDSRCTAQSRCASRFRYSRSPDNECRPPRKIELAKTSNANRSQRSGGFTAFGLVLDAPIRQTQGPSRREALGQINIQ